MLHPQHPSAVLPLAFFLPSPITFIVNIIIPRWFWPTYTTFTTTTSPSPNFGATAFIETMNAHHISDIIIDLTQNRWEDAFDTIVRLGTKMHLTGAKLFPLPQLRDINRLFEAILQHHAYGLDEEVDAIINRLFLRALHTCQHLTSQKSPDSDHHVMRWMSPAEIEMQEHLDFYRGFSQFLLYSSAPENEDSEEVQVMLQNLCKPTINNLTTWSPPSPIGGHRSVAPRHRRQEISRLSTTANKKWSSARLRSGVRKSLTSPSSSSSCDKKRNTTLQAKLELMLPSPPLTPTSELCKDVSELDDDDDVLGSNASSPLPDTRGWISTYQTEEYFPTQSPFTPMSSQEWCPDENAECGWMGEPTQLVVVDEFLLKHRAGISRGPAQIEARKEVVLPGKTSRHSESKREACREYFTLRPCTEHSQRCCGRNALS
ncbi:hypothetical protein QBC35DRAFT_393864 [Podospora australis]|uniref:Uncharacterized protein n=1 Tax=Podospora australis TaxID=1536484 RepID=A0AAN6WNJ3_9PEZI|nr:hypothetical protein QBC35DRAFT_393864 [Podospora australis]